MHNANANGRLESDARITPGTVLLNIVHAVASLKLTVFLFALSMVLVFVGTLAQMESSIWKVVDDYFYSGWVWVPCQLFVQLGQKFQILSPSWSAPSWLGFPFPGGKTIGWALFANLLAAHLVRFRLRWKRAGVLIIHSGVALLLLGEFVTREFQVEQRMTIAQGETVNFTDRSVPPRVELVVSREVDGEVEEVIIPHSQLNKAGRRISDDRLPFDLVIEAFAVNSALRETAEPGSVLGSDGKSYLAVAARTGGGVDMEVDEDMPTVQAKLLKKGSSLELATGTFSTWYTANTTRQKFKGSFQLTSQEIAVDGTTYRVELRPVREIKPFSLTLLEFKHDVYIGTDRPRNYSSLVRIHDPERGPDFDVLIYMNSPLRYRGESFFQSGVLPADKGTILHVVRNPGADLPYWSCGIVALGMIVQFGMQLVNFLGRRVGT